MFDPMGDRFKAYENVAEQVLPSRLPVLLRLDGNSFSKLTKKLKFKKPFDDLFDGAMEEAALAVLRYCSGARFAFIESDEITIALRNDQTVETTPFLANRTQKIASLTAATASVAFNSYLRAGFMEELEVDGIFDCRVYVVPESDLNNAILWRQFDSRRNCISGYAYYRVKESPNHSLKMLDKMSTADRSKLLADDFDLPEDKIPRHHLFGRMIYRQDTRWIVDKNLPFFKDDQNFVYNLFYGETPKN